MIPTLSDAPSLPSDTSLQLNPPRAALVTATVLSGLSAGFFFAYEASVTLGLARVSDVAYVETFQAINETVRNPAFGIVFFGSLPAIALALAVNWASATPVARRVLASALVFYVLGVLITGTGNVPLNNELAEVTNLTPEVASAARAEFEDDWNRFDLLRTLSFGASFVCLVVATAASPVRRGGGPSSS